MNEKEDDPDSTCFVCRKTLTTTTNNTCSRCHVVSYCSRECQTIHWKGGHKQTCRDGYIDIGGNHITDKTMYYAFFGFCLDCLQVTKNKKIYNISHFCDGCNHAYICNQHEVIHRVCKKCR